MEIYIMKNVDLFMLLNMILEIVVDQSCGLESAALTAAS